MPRSKKRRRAGRSVINILRGAGRTSHALNLARLVSGAGHVNAIPWAIKTLQIGGPLAALRPRTLVQLHSLPDLAALSLETELKWTLALLSQFASEINAALQHRAEFELKLLAGDGLDALEALDRQEAITGLSLGLLSNRLATLQIVKGLEAQKEESNRIRAANCNPNVRFFSYWWSARAEEGSTWKNFQRDFERRLKVWEIAEEFRAHIGFQMLRTIPPEGSEATFLAGALRGSSLDYYEAFLAVAQAAINERRPSADSFAICCRELSGKIIDDRLQKLLFLHGDDSVARPFELAPTSRRDSRHGKATQSEPVSATTIGELFGVGVENSSNSRGTLPQRVAHAMGEILSPGGKDRGLAEILKLSGLLDHIPTGGWLRTIATAPGHLEDFSHRQSAQLFATTGTLEPETLGWVEPARLPVLQANTLTGIPSSPSWQWNLVRQGHTALADVEQRLSDRSRAELQLIRALKAGDYQNVLGLVAHLHKVAGDVTELGLRAEIEATRSISGVSEAIKLSVDYLLARPQLASWLPLVMLAEDAMSLEVGKSNIDGPIILDFAAKVADAKLSSNRTYAAEDYLTEFDATSPSKMCERIPAENATERELFFFGEICVPASLRTSTLFENERDLESDRIEVCRWLISASPGQAERFEEEARELVRTRHIKLGIQSLQGSKLSIDRDSLRTHADLVALEEYVRYMDQLEQGIFVPDQDFREIVYAVISGELDPQQLQIPDNEAAVLFADMIRKLMRELSLHPEHGLDAYLSLRIRHGTLSGHLRGPVEREHLVTRRDSAGRYLENDHWTERLAGELEYDCLEHINLALQELARKLDALIATLTQDFIQVRRDEKPQGVIVTVPSAQMLAAMISETSIGQSFDDFFVRSEDAFWALVDASSTNVAAALAQVKTEAETAFDQTEEAVRAVAGDGAGSLKDALLRAKAAVVSAIDNIGDWLVPPTTPASLSMSVEDHIRVALATISGFYRDFEPKLTFDLAELPMLTGMVRLFSDIFFIIFENVLKYSGNSINPTIHIQVWEEGNQIKFCVENSVELVTDEAVERIARAKEQIASGSFRRAVPGEGGTGLPKLAKVIGLGSGGGQLEFDLAADRKSFTVRFGLRLIDFAPAPEEEQ